MASDSQAVTSSVHAVVRNIAKNNKRKLLKLAEANLEDVPMLLSVCSAFLDVKKSMRGDEPCFGRGTQYINVINKEWLLEGMSSMVPDLLPLCQYVLTTKQKECAATLFCVGSNTMPSDKIAVHFPRNKECFFCCAGHSDLSSMASASLL